MKLAMVVLVACLLLPVGARSQFKSQEEQPSAAQSLVHPLTGMNSFFGLFNPDNFRMSQSLSYSFASSGGQGLSVASFTNSMFYQIADPLDVRLDMTLQGTPLSAASPYGSSLNGLFLSRAELNYRPWQNVFIQLGYNHLPASFFNSYYDPWDYPFSSSAVKISGER